MINALVLFGSVGFGYTFIANLSHIQHECIQINTENKNDFLYNQVTSTINYKTNNPIIRFICFSLDIQIEHHLFPNIPHSSLRQIHDVVRGYCDKNNIPYIEKPSIFPTIYSYIYYLYKMGNP
jgi:linoleoyl-CoA desaturase